VKDGWRVPLKPRSGARGTLVENLRSEHFSLGVSEETTFFFFRMFVSEKKGGSWWRT
jgi:hypothetical protein